MAIHVLSRRKSAKTIEAAHPGAFVADLSSKGPEPWRRFSPFFPHGGIPVPYSPGVTAACVEGIWQGLKVFHGVDVDPAAFRNDRMRGLKRTVRRFGPVRGHRRGVEGDELLDYVAARRVIYLPAYRFVLEHHLSGGVVALRERAEEGDVVLLDYETNTDVDDTSRPLSHAGLVRAWLVGEWPG